MVKKVPDFIDRLNLTDEQIDRLLEMKRQAWLKDEEAQQRLRDYLDKCRAIYEKHNPKE